MSKARLFNWAAGLSVGVVSGLYAFDQPIRAATEEIMIERGMDPSTMPRSVWTGKQEVGELHATGPQPQMDLSYYRAEPERVKSSKKAWPIYKEGVGWQPADKALTADELKTKTTEHPVSPPAPAPDK